MSLVDIAEGKLTDKLSHHSYLPIYERLFAPYKHRAGKILEVGAWYGGSLLMWAEYFPKATVFGCEINRTPLPKDADPRIRLVQVDAYSDYAVTFLAALAPFMVLIDDGPHTLDSQETFCQRFPLLLEPGGIAIVEDVQSPDHVKVLAAAAPKGYETAAIDLRHVKGQYDDVLFLIWSP